MDVFPAAFPLRGLRVMIVGDGEAAEAKARLFEGSPAEVTHLAAAEAHLQARYASARLAFIALRGAAAEAAAQAARSAGALVNVVDRPDLCDFTTPAIVDRGAVVGAVMTGGAAPALATELRLALEAQWPPTLGQVATLLDRIKDEARARLPDPSLRRTFLRNLIRGPAGGAALDGRMAEAETLARTALATMRPQPPRIALIRAPEAPDLLSLRALRWLSEADRIVADPGVDPALVRLARRDAAVTSLPADGGADVMERLRPWLAALGGAGLLVRVCATDPTPEASALRAAGLAVEIA